MDRTVRVKVRILLVVSLACCGAACSDDASSDDGTAAIGGVAAAGATAGAAAGTAAAPAPVSGTGGIAPVSGMGAAPAPATGGAAPPPPATGGAQPPPATGGAGGAGGAAGEPPPAIDAGMPPAGGPLTLTAADFTEGGEIPDSFRCAGPSPALSWTGGPAATMSYALIMRDLTFPAIHWIIYDIPAGTTMLPQGVPSGAMPAMPAGAKQGAISGIVALVAGVDAVGYAGPCAMAGSMNMYQLTLHAVSVAELPGVTAGGDGAAIETAIIGSSLESTTLGFTSIP